ncbi:flagellar export chaperone FliS [Wenzhouxiangella limi]|uniref:Flagellar secretion chaperone FliS n=1 Tax=Wenzhouxiangella limi TaxID=2707351 RepID=A0A845V397_9GAMM|nr:flagellar export chaperone FliS [Wenzhouxiangella limi]NDY97122.1 flagellar export chaperone FliS [Wenzhouxiangella limi]
MNANINAYNQNAAIGAEETSPHRLVAMLYQGAIDRMSRAIGHCVRGEVAKKGECLSRAAAIVDQLRDSLDMEAGDGTLSQRLDDLYEYMIRRITEANFRNDTTMMKEVHDLLAQLAEGWNAIPPEQREVQGARPA